MCIYSENEKESGSNLATEVDMQGGPRDRGKALASEKGRRQGLIRVRFLSSSMVERQKTLRACSRVLPTLLLVHPIVLLRFCASCGELCKSFATLMPLKILLRGFEAKQRGNNPCMQL